MNVLVDLGTISPVWIVAVAAALVLLLTVASGLGQPQVSEGRHLAWVSVLSLVVAAALLWQVEGRGVSAFSGALLVDGLAAAFGVTAMVGGALAVVLAKPYLEEHGLSMGEFFGLVLLSSVGMLMLVMAGDLMTLFIGIETMSLAVYVLAGYRRSSRRAQEAALKYFVYGAFASAFLLFGIALMYGEAGRVSGTPSVTFEALAKVSIAGFSPLGWVAVVLILGGLAFKISAVPFHMWAPDVYEGAPTPSTGFMAVGVKAAAFAGLCRFVHAAIVAGGATETMIRVFEVIAMATMVLGNLMAVRQNQIKRMLAYSSIAHVGYALLGIVAWLANPSAVGVTSIAYYLFGYTAMTLGAFGVVLAFERKDDRSMDLSIDRLAGVGHRYPPLGLAMAVFMLSLAGVPPTAGFFGKLGLFYAAVEAGRVGVVLVGAMASAVGAYYYLRVLVVMYMRADSTKEQRVQSPWLSAGLAACGLTTLVVGILPETYLGFAQRVIAGWLG